MCWRDDVRRARVCSSCGEEYFGDLGHPGCPGRKPSAEEIQRQEKIVAVGERHGWDESTSREKIKRAKEILQFSEDQTLEFLLEMLPRHDRDAIDKLEEDHPPF